MIRALYTAASGMNAQQMNIDNVAHNLANVNTTGFKKSRVEFEDLVYDQTRVAGAPTSTTAEAPIGLETGLGVRAVATSRDFGRGNLKATNGPLDGMWADVQRQLKARGGIRRERMDLYLSSFVWRYNHRKLSAAEQTDALLRLLRQQG